MGYDPNLVESDRARTLPPAFRARGLTTWASRSGSLTRRRRTTPRCGTAGPWPLAWLMASRFHRDLSYSVIQDEQFDKVIARLLEPSHPEGAD